MKEMKEKNPAAVALGKLGRALSSKRAKMNASRELDALEPAKVRKLRLDLGLTQQAFADALGVHRTTVVRWETGVVEITPAQSMWVRHVLRRFKGVV